MKTETDDQPLTYHVQNSFHKSVQVAESMRPQQYAGPQKSLHRCALLERPWVQEYVKWHYQGSL